MKNRKVIEDLLDRPGILAHPCDLDLLLFFHRHPCTLLTNKQLAAYVGYDEQRVARSLNTLIGAGLLSQSRNPTRSAGMYLLTTVGTGGEWLQALLRVASTPLGRRDVTWALKQRQSSAHAGPRGVGPGRVVRTGLAGKKLEVAHGRTRLRQNRDQGAR